MFFSNIKWLGKKSLLHYWVNLLHYREVLHYWLILLHYREVLHYLEFITLLEQKIINDIFQNIPLVFMAAILKKGIRNPLGISNGFLARSNELKKNFISLLGKFITLLVDFITLSGSITLSGVHYIIGAKYYNWYISIYSSSFDGGHFENKYPNPTGHNKWIFRKIEWLEKKCLLHYWLNLLHYRDVLHYWLILLHYREVLHYREFITLLEQKIINDIFHNIRLVLWRSFENRHPNPLEHIKWIFSKIKWPEKKVYYIIG